MANWKHVKKKRKQIKVSEIDSDTTVNTSEFKIKDSSADLSELCSSRNHDLLEVMIPFPPMTKYLKEEDFVVV